MKRKSIIRMIGFFVTLPASLILFGLAFSLSRSRQIDTHRDVLSKTIGTLDAAATLYAKEHGNRLPPAENWEQTLRPDQGAIPLQVPMMPGGAGKRVAMNRMLAGRPLDSIQNPAAAILFFESTSSVPSTADDLTSLVPSGDPSPLLLGFADGHIEEIVPASRRDEVLARNAEACKASKPVNVRSK